MTDVNSMASQRSALRVTRNMLIGDGRYSLERRLGGGAFGELYQGVDMRTKVNVAIKLEKSQVACPQLGHEFRIYRMLHHGSGTSVGIPRVYYYGVESGFNALVMDLCGPSLEDLFNYCGRRFSLKTVCMLADQMLRRVEFLHEKGFLHRDMKPENFLFGVGKRGHILYLVDYGLSKPYWDKRKQAHIPFCEGKPMIGTARYCSIWTHQGYEQGRRDDLEGISFMLIYLLVGSLPWQGVSVKDQQLKTILIGERKMKTSLEELCNGLPDEILQYCKYCRNLKFSDQPQYARLRELFYTLAKKHNYLHSPSSTPYLTCSEKSSTTVAWTSGNCWENRTQREEYDWMFDWFVKRTAELSSGRKVNSPTHYQQQQQQNYQQQQQQQQQQILLLVRQQKEENELLSHLPKEQRHKQGEKEEQEQEEHIEQRQLSNKKILNLSTQISKTSTLSSKSDCSIYVPFMRNN